MTIIQIKGTSWNIRTLYKNANSKSTRALLGYMMKTGQTNNTILGGAFALLRDLECCNGLYTLHPCDTKESVKEIVAVAEATKAKAFKKFALSRREINKVRKQIKDLM